MDLQAWFTDTITVQSQVGSTASGDPIFGAQRTISGRIQTVLRKQATAKGEAVTNVSVFVTDQPIAQGDLFWLPGADTSKTQQARRVGEVTSGHDKSGAFTMYQVDV